MMSRRPLLAQASRVRFVAVFVPLPNPRPDLLGRPLSADLHLPLLREATIEAQRAGAVRHQQQEATGDRDVLQEHDHLDLVGEVGVVAMTTGSRTLGTPTDDIYAAVAA